MAKGLKAMGAKPGKKMSVPKAKAFGKASLPGKAAMKAPGMPSDNDGDEMSAFKKGGKVGGKVKAFKKGGKC